MRKSCRWKRSTCISPATSTPSAAPTTSRRDDRQPRSTGATSSDIDSRRIAWRRVMDMNDRALRKIVSRSAATATAFRARTASTSPSPPKSWRSSACRATSRPRSGGSAHHRGPHPRPEPVCAARAEGAGAMTVLLKDALDAEPGADAREQSAFVHGGPFANIAHGCNSVMATKLGLKLAEYVVTEAGFGADLGAEKFFDIKCRKAGLRPAATVIVATIRALKMHGGVTKEDLGKENIEALKKGISNLSRHVENVKSSACRPSSRSTVSPPTPTRNWRPCARPAPSWASRPSNAPLGRWRRRHGRAGPCGGQAGGGRRQQISRRSIRMTCRSGTRFGRSPSEIYGARASSPTRRSGIVRGDGEGRPRPLPDLHGEDAVQLLGRPEPRVRPPTIWCRCAK